MTTETKTLAEHEATRLREGRQRLVAAIWRSAPATELAGLAAHAGLSAAQADELIAKVKPLMVLSAIATQAPAREKAANAAKAKLDAIAVKNRSTIDRLESEIADLAYAYDDAQREFIDADRAARALTSAELNGLAPRSVLAEVAEARHAADLVHDAILRRFQHAEAVLQTAKNRAESRRSMFDNMVRDQVSNVNNVSIDDVKKGIRKADADVVEAEAALVKAAKEAIAAGYVVTLPVVKE